MLDEKQKAIFQTEKTLLQRLVAVLGKSDAEDDLAVVQRALIDLEDLFLLVVVGEFNAGKSAFINALVGERVLPEGVTPTTSAVTRLRFAELPTTSAGEDSIVDIWHPAEFLRNLSIVDTPGTNAVIRSHEEISRRFVPRSDLVLFVTSADRPFTESERFFLQQIREWGKKVVFVINKIDMLPGDKEVAEVVAFVRQHAQGLLGREPEIFPLSAKLALQAKRAGSPDLRLREWEGSRFGPLETYVHATLDEAGRLKLKLLNPLGVAQRVIQQKLESQTQSLTVLNDDFQTIEDIESQLDVYRSDMRHDFALHLSRVENVILEMRARGIRFFEDTLRLARVFDLIKSDRVKREFETVVIADSAREIDNCVQGLIDWMVDRDLRMWQAVMEFMERRRSSRLDQRMIGKLGGTYEYNRRELLNSVGNVARRVVDSYDREAEARQLAESVRVAVAQATLTEVGAIGLGTAVAVLIGTAAADVTGILAGAVVAGLGLLIIPAKKRRALAEFHEKTEDLRERLVRAMSHQFEMEIDQSVDRIREAIAPYTRFVRAEHERVTRQREELAGIDQEIVRLKTEIGLIG